MHTAPATIKKISLVFLIILYIGAGINHFWHPAAYYTIIPPYIPNPFVVNILSAVAELILGSMLIFPQTRKLAVYGIIAMLIAFIPAHIYMIQKGGCMGTSICMSLTGAWLRLVPMQFILMLWAWWHRNDQQKIIG